MIKNEKYFRDWEDCWIAQENLSMGKNFEYWMECLKRRRSLVFFHKKIPLKGLIKKYNLLRTSMPRDFLKVQRILGALNAFQVVA